MGMNPGELLQNISRQLTESSESELGSLRIDVVSELESVRSIAFADPRTGLLSRIRKTIAPDKFTYSRETHYRAAALLVLARFPVATLPIAMRTAPRPHGGRIWRAMIDIRTTLPDSALDALLSQSEAREPRFARLAQFANASGQFLPATPSQVGACADAWAVLLLTQSDWTEATKLVSQMVVPSAIRDEVKARVGRRSPELAGQMFR
jgi:hypothetical protein